MGPLRRMNGIDAIYHEHFSYLGFTIMGQMSEIWSGEGSPPLRSPKCGSTIDGSVK